MSLLSLVSFPHVQTCAALHGPPNPYRATSSPRPKAPSPTLLTCLGYAHLHALCSFFCFFLSSSSLLLPPLILHFLLICLFAAPSGSAATARRTRPRTRCMPAARDCFNYDISIPPPFFLNRLHVLLSNFNSKMSALLVRSRIVAERCPVLILLNEHGHIKNSKPCRNACFPRIRRLGPH